jgi:hypothetical protein
MLEADPSLSFAPKGGRPFIVICTSGSFYGVMKERNEQTEIEGDAEDKHLQFHERILPI